MANLTGELMGGSAAPTDGHRAGRPGDHPDARRRDVDDRHPAGRLHGRAGAGDRRAPPRSRSARRTCSASTSRNAVFPEPTPGPSGGTPTQAPVADANRDARLERPPASLAPGASGDAASRPRRRSNPNAPVRFAVDLFDPGESDIAPGLARRDRRARAPGRRISGARRVRRRRTHRRADRGALRGPGRLRRPGRRRRAAARRARRAVGRHRPDRPRRAPRRVARLPP